MEVVGQQVVGIVISVVIARHLSPSDYGLVGMIAIFLAIANVLINVGFPSALIRKQQVEALEYDSVFHFNMVLSLLLYGGLYLASSSIATFFATPALEKVSQVLFLTIVINALSMVHVIIATKALNFKTQAIVSMASTLASGVIGLWMAFSGYGYWALVAQQMMYSCLRSLLFWILIDWKPRLRFSHGAILGMMGFSAKLLASGLLDTLFTNMYGLAIGKFYGQASLGYYAQAEKFRNAPLGAMNSIVQRVSFPLLSSVQGDDERLSGAYRRLLRMVAFMTFPVLLFLAMSAEPLFHVVLTEKWAPSVEIFQWLCLAGMGWGVSSLSLSILQVKGRSDIYLGLEVAKKVVVILVFALTFRLGVLWLVRGVAGSMLLCVLLNFHYSGKQLSCSLWDQCKAVAPYLLVTLAGALLGAAVGRGIDSYLLRLFAQLSVACTSMLSLCWLLKLDAFASLVEVARSKLGK